jgi:hypothetical protein
MLQQSSAGDRGNPSPTAARTRRPRGPVGSPRPAARISNGAELAGACSYKRRSTRETGRRRRERAYRTNRVESVPAGGAARGSDRAFPPRFCARSCCGAAGGAGRTCLPRRSRKRPSDVAFRTGLPSCRWAAQPTKKGNGVPYVVGPDEPWSGALTAGQSSRVGSVSPV